MFRRFHPWPRLPTEVKVLVLEHVLQDDVDSLRTTPLYHDWYMQRYPPWIHSWYIGRINFIISTRNREIVDLALDIYYRLVKKKYFEGPATNLKPTPSPQDWRWWALLKKKALQRTRPQSGIDTATPTLQSSPPA
ncbi:hypothetical protein N0V86_007395 [Didymella sp. IMI 355093]|nr:hypothetical protein N0V86_007395 [Didymella sp. IMI 355093]